MEEERMKPHIKLFLIGGSAGSLEVLLQVLPGLRTYKQLPIVIVLHRKNDYDSPLTQLLAGKTGLTVKEVEEKEVIAPNTIYLAPADYHLLIEKELSFSLDVSEKVNYSRPSIDVTFESAAEACGPSLACILLSGANADGVEGLKAVKRSGGIIAAQHPDTAEVPYMPQQAIAHTAIDVVLRVNEIAAFINSLTTTNE